MHTLRAWIIGKVSNTFLLFMFACRSIYIFPSCGYKMVEWCIRFQKNEKVQVYFYLFFDSLANQVMKFVQRKYIYPQQKQYFGPNGPRKKVARLRSKLSADLISREHLSLAQALSRLDWPGELAGVGMGLSTLSTHLSGHSKDCSEGDVNFSWRVIRNGPMAVFPLPGILSILTKLIVKV